MDVQIKRVYEKPMTADGVRILIDRLWPRGLTKEKAKVDIWLKDIAPSASLRKWFGHDPHKWEEFRKRYRDELEHNSIFPSLLLEAKKGKVTLIYSARDERHNDAVVLKEYLETRL